MKMVEHKARCCHYVGLHVPLIFEHACTVSFVIIKLYLEEN